MNTDDIYIKFADNDIYKELNAVKFDSSYIDIAVDKYSAKLYKIFNLKPYEANIFKQICLSLGFDCAVNKDSITCKCEYSDCIFFAGNSQLRKLSDKLKKQPFRLKQTALKIDKLLNNNLSPLNIRNYTFDWSRPYIMGILNVTPDSFSDGGKYFNIDTAVKRAEELVSEGADFIDIGGESSRPGAVSVPSDEEIKRVIPVIKEIRKSGINIPVSVDTKNFKTAEKAINSGADIINDVSGFSYDKKLFDFVCSNNIPSVVMHSDNVPALSCDYTQKDIVEDVYFSLYKKIEKLIDTGLDQSNIIADCGIGFGKSKENCFELLKRHFEFSSLNVAMLLGISRKSFIRKEYNITVENTDIPTALLSLKVQGVNIHRVHNVSLLKSYLDITSKI